MYLSLIFITILSVSFILFVGSQGQLWNKLLFLASMLCLLGLASTVAYNLTVEMPKLNPTDKFEIVESEEIPTKGKLYLYQTWEHRETWLLFPRSKRVFIREISKEELIKEGK